MYNFIEGFLSAAAWLSLYEPNLSEKQFYAVNRFLDEEYESRMTNLAFEHHLLNLEGN